MPTNSSNKHNDSLESILTMELESLSTTIRDLNKEIRAHRSITEQNGQRLAKLEEAFDSLEKQTDNVFRTVVTGNGKESLVTQLNTVQMQIKNINKTCAERREHFATNKLSRTQIIVALITFFGTAAASIVSAVVTIATMYS